MMIIVAKPQLEMRERKVPEGNNNERDVHSNLENLLPFVFSLTHECHHMHIQCPSRIVFFDASTIITIHRGTRIHIRC